MLALRTGLPGSGKTLNTIKELDEAFGADPKQPDKELRTIYYNGIPELDNDKLTAKWVQFDTPEEWFNLPDGSVIVIDEAQRIFPAKDSRKEAPPSVTRFETHRHQGLDIHLVTQDPRLLSAHVRRLVGKHIHMYRPYGGEKLVRHEYEWCVDDPNKRTNFKMAQESKPKLDPKYFGVYKSAFAHTHKFKLPSYFWKIPAAFAFIAACLGLFFYIFFGTSFGPEVPEETAAETAPAAAPAASAQAAGKPTGGTPLNPSAAVSGAMGVGKAMTEEQYVGSMEPRIEDVPVSAPRYDQLNKPKDVPRLVCAASFDPGVVVKSKNRNMPVGMRKGREYTCQCYTQQVTKVRTTAEFCLDIVENGYFDDTRLPLQPRLAQTNAPSSSHVSVAGGLAPQQTHAQDGTRVTIVNSGKPGHLW